MSSKNTKLLLAGLCLFFGRYAISRLLSSKKNQARLRQIPPNNSRSVSCPSGNVWYAEFDGPEDGQPIVLIHGLQSTRLQWHHQQKHLRTRYRLVLVDLPGHGRSSKATSMNITVLAGDLKYVLAQLSIQNPILYGHSIGGMILLRYCINNNNDQVRGLILQNCSYTNPMKTCLFPAFMQSIEAPIFVPFLEFVKRHHLVFNLLGRVNYLSGISVLFYRFLLFSGSQSVRELLQICRAAAIFPPEVLVDGILNTLKHETGPLLHLISSKCLVIGGEDDRIIRPQTAFYIAEHVQDGRAKVMPGGHLNMIEYPNQVNDELDKFLESLE